MSGTEGPFVLKPDGAYLPFFSTRTRDHEVRLQEVGPMKLRAYLTPTIDFGNASGLVNAVAFNSKTPYLLTISQNLLKRRKPRLSV